jgi:hypothetical protein
VYLGVCNWFSVYSNKCLALFSHLPRLPNRRLHVLEPEGPCSPPGCACLSRLTTPGRGNSGVGQTHKRLPLSCVRVVPAGTPSESDARIPPLPTPLRSRNRVVGSESLPAPHLRLPYTPQFPSPVHPTLSYTDRTMHHKVTHSSWPQTKNTCVALAGMHAFRIAALGPGCCRRKRNRHTVNKGGAPRLLPPRTAAADHLPGPLRARASGPWGAPRYRARTLPRRYLRDRDPAPRAAYTAEIWSRGLSCFFLYSCPGAAQECDAEHPV